MARWGFAPWLALACASCSSPASWIAADAPAASPSPRRCASVDGGVRRALLVGIGKYPSYRDTKTGQAYLQLRGAANSVEAMRRVLCARGFTDIRVLGDEDEPTKARISSEIARLTRDASPDDHVLIYYFGHGIQITDLPRGRDEHDGYDEALVAWPASERYDESSYLRDDQLEKLVDDLTAAVKDVVVVLDSCHSGTGLRGEAHRLGGGEPIGDPAPLPDAEEEAGGAWISKSSRKQNLVFVSAAGPEESAMEIRSPSEPDAPDPQWIGAFTYLFTQTLASTTAGTTWRQAVERTRSRMYLLDQAQRPQAEGEIDRVIFTTNEGKVQTSWSGEITSDGSSVQITDGGWLQGFEVGTHVELLDAGGEIIGEARVHTAALQSSLAGILEGGPPLAARRPVRVSISWKKDDLYVARLDPASSNAHPVLTKLVKRLRSSDRVEVGGLKKRATDLRFELDRGASSVSIVTGQDGIAIPIPVDCKKPQDSIPLPKRQDAEGVDLAVAHLENAIELHRIWSRIEGMTNPAPLPSETRNPEQARLEVALTPRVTGKIVTDDGRRSCSREALTRGEITANERDGVLPRDACFLLEIENRSDVPARVAVLERTTTGYLQLLFPNPVWGETPDTGVVPPNGRITLPRDTRNPYTTDPVDGQVSWKLVAMQDPSFADFFGLANDVPCPAETPTARGAYLTRSGRPVEKPATNSALDELFSDITTGTRTTTATRGPKGAPSKPPPGTRWGEATLTVATGQGS